MKNDLYVFENASGQTVRVIHFGEDKLHIVYLLNSKSVDFVSCLSTLDENDINYTEIAIVKKADLDKKPFPILNLGVLRSTTSLSPAAPEVELPKEDEKKFPLFLKRSAVGHVAILVVLLLTSWIMSRFFSEQKPVTVTVFEQKRPTQEVEEFVAVSKKKISEIYNNYSSHHSNKHIACGLRYAGCYHPQNHTSQPATGVGARLA